MGNLSTPANVQKLQTALHAKAKSEPGFRFYALYDKIYRDDILAHAWAQCRSNQGAPGVDGKDFADVETYGVQRWLGELALALRHEKYQPDPIRRVFIPKANGKLRPLGISTLRDRVCMTAAMLVLDPIFEADLPPEQYAYRRGRNAQQAVIEVEDTLFRNHPEVVDADLADYFGSIPHAELMRSLARRIVDKRVLHLIKMWLECAVEETDDRGRKTRTTVAKDSGRGIPQGSPITPWTQKITFCRAAGFRSGCTATGVVALARRRRVHGYRVPDRDAVIPDHDLLDQQPRDALPFNDIEVASVGPQAVQEGRQRFSQPQVSGPAVELCPELPRVNQDENGASIRMRRIAGAGGVRA